MAAPGSPKREVVQIKRALLSEDVVQAELARRYGVSRWTIRDIKEEKTWKHVRVLPTGKGNVAPTRRAA